MVKLMLKIICLFSSLLIGAEGNKYKLRLNSNYTLGWEVEENEYINFSALVRTTGWIGFAINDRPKMDGAELIILGVKEDNTPYLYSYQSVGHILVQDEKSHWAIGYGKFTESSEINATLVHFMRPLESWNKDGINIEDKELYLLWSFGETDDIEKMHVDRGVVRINLIHPNKSGTEF